MHEVFIQFQNCQVVVRTNMSAIEHFVRESHAPMIAGASNSPVAAIDAMKVEGGYKLGEDIVAAEGDPSILFDPLRQLIQKAFVRARTDLVWMHAGAVAAEDAAIIIAGPSTAGKSTLVTHLMDSGLSYMTDELVALHADATVNGFPRVPVRRSRSDRLLTRVEMGDLGRETVKVPSSRIRHRDATMRAIVFAKYTHGAATELTRVSSGHAAIGLFQTLLDADAKKDHVLPTIASIARTVPAYRLIFSDAISATQSILNMM